MCEEVAITSKLLDITKMLAENNLSFSMSLTFTIKDKEFQFSASSSKTDQVLYFSLSFSPISSPICSPLFHFTPIPSSYPLLYVSPIYLYLIYLSPFSLTYLSSMYRQFCNPAFSLP